MNVENKPRFSIIMPVYNREKIVGTAIESVLAQDYALLQLICIDDGSTDNTKSVLKHYAEKDNRVLVCTHEKNKGRSAARNTGINAATGQWLCFLDSDDVYFPTHLSLHSGLISEKREYNCFATGQLIYGKPKKYPFRLTNGNREVTLTDLITGNFISLNQISIRREVAPFFFPETVSYAEDLLYMRRILEKNTLLLISEVTTDVLPEQTRSILTEKAVKIAADNWEGAKSFCIDKHAGNINKRILSHTALFCTSLLLSAKERKGSFLYFKKALSFSQTYRSALFYKVLLKYLAGFFLRK